MLIYVGLYYQFYTSIFGFTQAEIWLPGGLIQLGSFTIVVVFSGA